MATDFSKIGKANKRLGARVETESGKYWSKILDSKIIRTPRSGGLGMSFPGDIMDLGKSIIKEDNWIIDVKGGKSAVPKRIEDQMEKLKDDAQTGGSRRYWLEITKPRGETYVILTRENFANLLKDLQQWREDNRE